MSPTLMKVDCRIQVDRRNFVAKVTDFGLSTQMMEGARNPVADFCGTASHMAPELLTDGLASPATDAYAFGILSKRSSRPPSM